MSIGFHFTYGSFLLSCYDDRVKSMNRRLIWATKPKNIYYLALTWKVDLMPALDHTLSSKVYIWMVTMEMERHRQIQDIYESTECGLHWFIKHSLLT